MADVKIYRTSYCPYCDMAERMFREMDVDFEEIDVTNDPETRKELAEKTGMRTVPQIFIDGESIGGFDEARAMRASGELEEILKGSA